jgi:transposase
MNPVNTNYGVLSAWSDLKDGRISTRSKMVLDSINGQSKDEIAMCHKIPKREVEKWIVRYELLGVAGLIDVQRGGRPQKTKKLQAINRFTLKTTNDPLLNSQELKQFAKRIGRTPDVIWSKARLLGRKICRNRNPDLNIVCTEDIVKSGLIGLFLHQDIQIAAFQNERPWSNGTITGKWIRPLPDGFERKGYSKIKGVKFPLLTALEFSNKNKSSLPQRALLENWIRWINTLVFNDPPYAQSLHFVLGGNVDCDLIFKTLRLTHPYRGLTKAAMETGDVQTKLTISLHYDHNQWIQEVIKRSTISNKGTFSELSNWIETKDKMHKFFAWFRLEFPR